MTILIKTIEITYPEGNEVAMTLAEIFRSEGREEGILKGREVRAQGDGGIVLFRHNCWDGLSIYE